MDLGMQEGSRLEMVQATHGTWTPGCADAEQHVDVRGLAPKRLSTPGLPTKNLPFSVAWRTPVKVKAHGV